MKYSIKIAEHFEIKHDNVEYMYTTQTDNRFCDLYQGVLLPKIGKFMRSGSQAQLASFGTLLKIALYVKTDKSENLCICKPKKMCEKSVGYRI